MALGGQAPQRGTENTHNRGRDLLSGLHQIEEVNGGRKRVNCGLGKERPKDRHQRTRTQNIRKKYKSVQTNNSFGQRGDGI